MITAIISTHIYPEWRIRSHHDRMCRRILRRLGCMDKKLQLRVWKGKQVLKEFNNNGHSQLGFNGCKCNNLIRREF